MAAEEATKASQANVTSWEEVQEQPSDDSSNRNESVEQSEMSVVEQQVEEPGKWLDEEVLDLPILAEDLFLPDRPARKKLTRSECRRQRRQYATISDTIHQLDGGASRLQTAQESDSTLDIIRKSVHNGDKQYLMEDGLLFRVAGLDGTEEYTRQLVYLEYQGDGTQNSSLSTNGRTSWTKEDDKQTARKILLARNIYGHSGTMLNLSKMPESSMSP